MEISQYGVLLWRQRWIILITLLVSGVIAVGGTYLIKPQYESSTLVRIATTTRGSPDWIDFDLLYADRMMNTYAAIAASNRVQTEVMQRLSLSSRPSVGVEIVPNTELMRISVRDSNPVRAAEIANIYTEVLIEQIRFLANTGQAGTDEQTQDRLSHFLTVHPLLLEPATVSTSPVSPNPRLNLMLGLFLGALGGLGLALLLSNLDSTLYTTDEIETVANLPILAQIPKAAKDSTDDMPGTLLQQEAYRRLRMQIMTQDRPRTLLVTSAQPGEGKTTVITHLAAAIARAGHSVVVVDGNLLAPSVHMIFNVPNKYGLSNYLEKKAFLEQIVQKTSLQNLHVVASGPSLANKDLLDSERMKSLLEHLQKRFAIVLLDSPALLSTADAAALATLVDGVLLIVSSGLARREAVHEAQRWLVRLDASPIGVAVNRANVVDYRTNRNQHLDDAKHNLHTSTSVGKRKIASSVALER